jgi:hypothetical protein
MDHMEQIFIHEFLKTPDKSDYYHKAIEFMKKSNDFYNIIGTKVLIELYKEKYGPVLQLFEMILDEHNDELRQSYDTIKNKLIRHYTH